LIHDFWVFRGKRPEKVPPKYGTFEDFLGWIIDQLQNKNIIQLRALAQSLAPNLFVTKTHVSKPNTVSSVWYH